MKKEEAVSICICFGHKFIGDKSDNLKGADKVGPKTAAYLLNKFGTLENILANAESIEKPSIQESIVRNAKRLRINYRIIKLDNTVPLPLAMNDIVYNFTEITTNEVLKGIGLR